MKKAYFQPEVTVASISLNTMILTCSAGDQMGISNTPTSSQW